MGKRQNKYLVKENRAARRKKEQQELAAIGLLLNAKWVPELKCFMSIPPLPMKPWEGHKYYNKKGQEIKRPAESPQPKRGQRGKSFLPYITTFCP